LTNEAIDEDITDLTTPVLEDDSAILQPSLNPKQRGSNEFEFLSELEKVDVMPFLYCYVVIFLKIPFKVLPEYSPA
jgi:hypothetical protein